MIDHAKKRRLIEYIDSFAPTNSKELPIDVERFFDGYDAPCCTLCANCSEPLSASAFRDRLRVIASRRAVSGIFVRFVEYRDAKEVEDSWIGSDSVYVITSASVAEVRDWFSDLEVSDVWEEKDLSRFLNLPSIPEDFRLVTVWWD
jgi:hypothetical protein